MHTANFPMATLHSHLTAVQDAARRQASRTMRHPGSHRDCMQPPLLHLQPLAAVSEEGGWGRHLMASKSRRNVTSKRRWIAGPSMLPGAQRGTSARKAASRPAWYMSSATPKPRRSSRSAAPACRARRHSSSEKSRLHQPRELCLPQQAQRGSPLMRPGADGRGARGGAWPSHAPARGERYTPTTRPHTRRPAGAVTVSVVRISRYVAPGRPPPAHALGGLDVQTAHAYTPNPTEHEK